MAEIAATEQDTVVPTLRQLRSSAEATQPQRVGDQAEAGERHRSRGDDRAEQPHGGQRQGGEVVADAYPRFCFIVRRSC